jgi:stage V sporulation protein R
VHSLDNLIDPSLAVHRPRRAPTPRPTREAEQDARRVEDPAKDYMDRYINPPEFLGGSASACRPNSSSSRGASRSKPVRDVLKFLLEHANRSRWQQDHARDAAR